MRPRLRLQALWVMLFFAFSMQLSEQFLLHAQQNVGEIVGVGSDPAGARVPDAFLTARSLSTGVQLEAHANPEGAYRFVSLPIGECALTVGAPDLLGT